MEMDDKEKYILLRLIEDYSAFINEVESKLLNICHGDEEQRHIYRIIGVKLGSLNFLKDMLGYPKTLGK